MAPGLIEREEPLNRAVVLAFAIAAIASPQHQHVVPSTSQLVRTDPCGDGLYYQPGDAAFAAMLFCDDALGSNLGVVCYSGNLCSRPPWAVTDRFWQHESWAADVNAFAWDPNGRCLYVSTNAIYGEGDIFALDLWDRRVKRLPLGIEDREETGFSHVGRLSRIDDTGRTLEYEVEYYDKADATARVKRVTVPLPACWPG
jgi:hypothetical protein